MSSQADFVSELFEADVAIFPGPVWLVAHEVPLEPRPVNGPVAAEVTLKRMLVWVVILEVNLAYVLIVRLRVRIKGSINLYLADPSEHSLTDAALLRLHGPSRQRLHPPDRVLQVDVVVVCHVQQNVLKLRHSEVTTLEAAFYQTIVAKKRPHSEDMAKRTH